MFNLKKMIKFGDFLKILKYFKKQNQEIVNINLIKGGKQKKRENIVGIYEKHKIQIRI